MVNDNENIDQLLLRMDTKRIVSIFLHIFLFFLTAFYVTKQFLEFLENKDSSAMMFRTYNDLEKDKYPTFSMCLTIEDLDGDETWRNTDIIRNFYQEKIINEVFGKDISYFYGALQGHAEKNLSFSSLEFDQAKRNLLKSIYLRIIGFNGVVLQSWYYDESNSSSLALAPFYVAYQEPQMLCITRNDTFYQKKKIATEHLVMNFKNWIGAMNVYVHYPGQLMPDIDGRKKKWLQVPLRNDSNIVPSFDVDIFQLNILRKRYDSVTPCNKDNENNLDTRWRENVINNVKCVPTYWKNLEHSSTKNNYSLEQCLRADQYSNLFNEFLVYGEGRVQYDPSCTSATMTKIVRKDDSFNQDWLLSIQFNHQSEEYIEILNSRATTWEELFGQVGGWIGTILGYSLVQFPKLLYLFLDAVKIGWIYWKKRLF